MGLAVLFVYLLRLQLRCVYL